MTSLDPILLVSGNNGVIDRPMVEGRPGGRQVGRVTSISLG